MDTELDTSLRDRLVCRRIPNIVERGGQTASTSFNIRDNKRNVKRLLKQSLNAFKLVPHRLNFDSTCFNTVERRGQTISTSVFHKIERMLKEM